MTFEDFQKEVEPYIGTLVLYFFEVVRLMEVNQDEDDVYYVYYTKQGIVWSSVLTGFMPLKGALHKDEYDRLVEWWKINMDDVAI